MAANSIARRALKYMLAAALADRHYAYLQSVAMAWDIRRGKLSEPEISLVPMAVQNGDAVIDIGANYGLYTHHLSRAVGSTGRVYAFEPIPFTNSVLRLVGRLLGFRNVEVFEKGCSSETSRQAFTVPVQVSGAIAAGLAHLSAEGDEDAKLVCSSLNNATAVICEVVALDDFMPPLREISFIKCDIEGAELLAFRGCETMIARHHPTVLSEVYREYLGRFHFKLEDLTGFFIDRGYRLFTYDGASQGLIETPPEAVVDGNVLFIHPDRQHRFHRALKLT
ncbi:MAG: hypothetical protein DLM54_04825 [Acidimicrobiales bacterium]|nr:MAG: hypothetical protein DLM54_04825 [Acidimicrobiales bacterium]